MKNENKSNSNGSLLLKIVLPLLIVSVVAGIFAVKAIQKAKDTGDDTTTAQNTAAENSDSAGNPDFALNVTNNNLDIEKLKSYGLPIIIEFGADWCAPCKQMAPIIKALNEELTGKAIVRFVNTDENQKISGNYDFQYIPTQLFINSDGTAYNPPDAAAKQMDLHYDKNNKLLYTTHTGTITKAELLSILEEMGME